MADENGTGVVESTPPANTPPANTPPANTPPANTPPANTPPANTPPVVTNKLVELGLPQDILKHERLSGVTSVEELVDRLVNANLAPEIPTPDKYTLPEGVPDTVRQIAHTHKLTQSQLDGVVKEFAALNAASSEEAVNSLISQSEAKLSEWGDQKDAKLAAARNAVNYFEGKHSGLKSVLSDTGYAYHPVIMEVFSEVGKLLGEGGFISGVSNTPAVKKSAADALFPTQAKN
jgi:hypothetical protein